MINFLAKMANLFPFVKDLFQQAEIKVDRAHIMRPLIWAIPILLGFAVYGYQAKMVPRLVCAILLVIAIICVFLFLFIYAFYAFKNPDLLRSERYNIQKVMIERGLVGDNMMGTITSEDMENLKKLGSGEANKRGPGQ